MPLLTRVFDKSEGAVLELGTGYFSTLYLDWLCSIFGRKLVSYECNQNKFKDWGKRALRYKSSHHEINIIEDWNKADIENRHWGLVLVDHSPRERRVIEAIRIANNADYVVLHDTEPEAEKYYHYSKVYPHFKYRYNYKKVKPWTTVVSNFKSLNNM